MYGEAAKIPIPFYALQLRHFIAMNKGIQRLTRQSAKRSSQDCAAELNIQVYKTQTQHNVTVNETRL